MRKNITHLYIMKGFYYLIIILVSSLILYNFIGFREGLDSCPAGQTNAAVQNQERCNSVNAKVNQDLLASVKKNMQELQNLFDKTSKRIQTNTKYAQSNFVNAQKLEDVLDGKDIDTSAACKKYPEAC